MTEHCSLLYKFKKKRLKSYFKKKFFLQRKAYKNNILGRFIGKKNSNFAQKYIFIIVF